MDGTARFVVASPPAHRLHVTPSEASAIQAVLGVVTDVRHLRALRDARGRRFERLEFLGDSVLDVIISVHRLLAPQCPSCPDPHDGTPVVSDRALATRARIAQMDNWLEWKASDQRLADLVEACIAVVWLERGWSAALDLVTSVVHGMDKRTTQALVGLSRPSSVGEQSPRGLATLGSAIIELAIGHDVYRDRTGVGPGELTRLRATRHRTVRIAGFARTQGLASPSMADAEAADKAEMWIAQKLLDQGPNAALASALSSTAQGG